MSFNKNLTEAYKDLVKTTLTAKVIQKKIFIVANDPTFEVEEPLKTILSKRSEEIVWRRYYEECPELEEGLIYSTKVRKNPCLRSIEILESVTRFHFNRASLFPTFCYDLFCVQRLLEDRPTGVVILIDTLSFYTSSQTVVTHYGILKEYDISRRFMNQHNYDIKRVRNGVKIKFRALKGRVQKLVAWIEQSGGNYYGKTKRSDL